MAKLPEILQGPIALAVLRLLQIHVLAADLAATALPVDRGAKQRALGKLIAVTRAFASDSGAPPELRPLEELREQDPTASAGECIGLLPSLTTEQSVAALVELTVSTSWALKDLNFAGDRAWYRDRHRDSYVAAASELLPITVTPLEVEEIRGHHERTVKRLRRDSMAPSTQATLGAIKVTLAVVGGAGVDSVGGFIGGQMGLSGAAATSAGLAWLGGGSLATGGFGMAGGTFLLHAASHTVTTGGASLAARLAGTSPSAFISELAKLDVVVERGGCSAADVVPALRVLESQLAESHERALQAEGGYRAHRVVRTLGEAIRDPDKIAGLPNDVKHELKGSAATNLATAQRAVEYEIRHLTAEHWKRFVQKVPRWISMPALSKTLDRL